MITRWKTYRARRHQIRMDLVRTALRVHAEESIFTIARCAGLSVPRLHVYLAELEVAGEVTSRWVTVEGPYPRRRLYRLADNHPEAKS